jgi:hypothetical protein
MKKVMIFVLLAAVLPAFVFSTGGGEAAAKDPVIASAYKYSIDGVGRELERPAKPAKG